VALVATSASKLQSHETGLWLEELAGPYYVFQNVGYEIVIASPEGGAIPIDAASLGDGFFTDASKKFLHDATAVGMLSHSVKVSDLDLDSIDALFMTGGHGTCTDFIGQPPLKTAIETVHKKGKVVCAVCHGPMCLVDCKNEDGSPLIQGKKVTGFTNTEEEAVQLTSTVPFLLEDKMKELGGFYERADDWNSKVCVDDKLITGQNPQSSESCAEAVVKVLSS